LCLIIFCLKVRKSCHGLVHFCSKRFVEHRFKRGCYDDTLLAVNIVSMLICNV